MRPEATLRPCAISAPQPFPCGAPGPHKATQLSHVSIKPGAAAAASLVDSGQLPHTPPRGSEGQRPPSRSNERPSLYSSWSGLTGHLAQEAPQARHHTEWGMFHLNRRKSENVSYVSGQGGGHLVIIPSVFVLHSRLTWRAWRLCSSSDCEVCDVHQLQCLRCMGRSTWPGCAVRGRGIILHCQPCMAQPGWSMS